MINGYRRYARLLLVIVVAGCASLVGRPTVTQLTSDPPIFLLAYPLTFAADDNKEGFYVPPGFVTDLASIPKKLWWWQAPHEGTMAPAILHDFLYWEQPCSKDEADAVMYVAMRQTGMKKFSADLVYAGIRTPLALKAWEQNQLARARGEARFFTQEFSAVLINGTLDSKTSIAIIQAEAKKANGVLIPSLPKDQINGVCQAALKEFHALRAS